VPIILFNPTRIQIPLLQALWAFIPSIWKSIYLDFFILLPAITLFWDRNMCAVTVSKDDVSAAD